MMRATPSAACLLALVVCSHAEPAPAQGPVEGPTLAASVPLAACEEYTHLYDTCLAKSEADDAVKLRGQQGVVRAHVAKGLVVGDLDARDGPSADRLEKEARAAGRKHAVVLAVEEKGDARAERLVLQCKTALAALPKRCK